ncbi:GAP family protein [Actinocatenispora rupis]|uniref:Sap, sulfolipid-1-addressing protein n=1 Tax=Actinocatenispora rupis TaxID=519421 RepID=A0A8J3JI24_9ACTN|nr:GAP family protein [Actinocatenispora rupis]GID16273.1 hypothetical protein Aru02nite_71620 [Actinocatenispora rupis]
MGATLLAVLPYAVGLLVSPLPAVAVAVLLMGADGRLRAGLFVLFWWLAGAVVCLLLTLALRYSSPGARLPDGATTWLTVALGAALVAVALLYGWGMASRRRDRGWQPPGWLYPVGTLPVRRVGPFAAGLLLRDPLNLVLLVAAAVVLAGTGTDRRTDLLAVALLALGGTLGVAVPLVVALGWGWSATVRMHHLRGTVIWPAPAVRFWLSVGYAALLLT